jgi:fluoride ion exporter CrcB/FEX
MKSGNLNFLEPSVPLQACNGTALPFIFTHLYSRLRYSATHYVLAVTMRCCSGYPTCSAMGVDVCDFKGRLTIVQKRRLFVVLVVVVVVVCVCVCSLLALIAFNTNTCVLGWFCLQHCNWVAWCVVNQSKIPNTFLKIKLNTRSRYQVRIYI